MDSSDRFWLGLALTVIGVLIGWLLGEVNALWDVVNTHLDGP